MLDINSLTYIQILTALATGIIIGCIYLFLLWQTLLMEKRSLPRSVKS